MSLKDILKDLGLTSDTKETRRKIKRVKRPNSGFKNKAHSLEIKRMMNGEYDPAPNKIQGKPVRYDDRDETFHRLSICDMTFLFKKKSQ